MHFLCVDNRIKKNNGATYIKLLDGQEVLLPPTVTKVPALLLLNKGHMVLFGEEINSHLQSSIDSGKQAAVQPAGEPMSYNVNSVSTGVASDNYSYLDQSPDDLSAKGIGGMRQQHHYASIASKDGIETPVDGYAPDTIGDMSVEKLMQQREKDINIGHKPAF